MSPKHTSAPGRLPGVVILVAIATVVVFLLSGRGATTALVGAAVFAAASGLLHVAGGGRVWRALTMTVVLLCGWSAMVTVVDTHATHRLAECVVLDHNMVGA